VVVTGIETTMLSYLKFLFAVCRMFGFHHALTSVSKARFVKDDVSCLDMPARHSWINSRPTAIFDT